MTLEEAFKQTIILLKCSEFLYSYPTFLVYWRKI